MEIKRVLIKDWDNRKKTSWLISTVFKRPFYQFVDMSIDLLDENGNIAAKSVWPIIEDNRGYVIYRDLSSTAFCKGFHGALETFIEFVEQNPNEHWELRQFDSNFLESRILEYSGKKEI